MRSLQLTLTMIVALAACGPSNKEIATAKQARYTGDKLAIFNAAKAAAETKHKIAKSDETALGFQTVARWFTNEGVVARGTDENYQDVPSNAIRMTLVVRMLPDGSNWIVQVEPVMHRKIDGSPQPQPLDPKDPSLQGWTHGQADALALEIYKALAPYRVQTVGGVAPDPAAPMPAPAASEPAPADPTGTTEPAAGSAAPAQ